MTVRTITLNATGEFGNLNDGQIADLIFTTVALGLTNTEALTKALFEADVPELAIAQRLARFELVGMSLPQEEGESWNL